MVREFYNPEIRIPKKETREAFALAELDPDLESVLFIVLLSCRFLELRKHMQTCLGTIMDLHIIMNS